MSGRELVILLLGLAIVAVVLRGLYVAINARRGQIRLAIDKNIPQNVDLEALEMAELPGGGARVVTRSLEEVNRQNSALDKAESKAKAINLADDDDESPIPVLMDAVELAEPTIQQAAPAATPEAEELSVAAAEDAALDELIEDEFTSSDEEEFGAFIDQAPNLGNDWDEDEDEDVAASIEGHAELQAAGVEEEDPDAILFDYDEEYDEEEAAQRKHRSQIDTLSSVAPDYDENEEDYAEQDDAPVTESTYDNGYNEDDIDAGAQDELAEAEQEAFDTDNDVDEFSMTAGERIGGNPSIKSGGKQSGLFDDDAEDDKPKKGRTLFSMFGRKSSRSNRTRDVEPADSFDQEADEKVNDERPRESLQQRPLAEQQTIAYEEELGDDELDEAGYDDGYDELDEELSEELSEESGQIETAAKEEQAQQADAHQFEQSEVLVLNVTAKDGRVFSGDDLLHILITSGLKFGDMNIFHKRLSKDNQGSVIFSVANMLNPGTFDLNNMDEFTTLGISFFLALPTPINNLDAFEQMLGVAQLIRDTLDGDLKDDHRNGMTAQTIEHYRQRIRDFELRRLKAAAARA
ncbi:MAG: cell division protein ZipA [Pseudohongiellaceae bacterium]